MTLNSLNHPPKEGTVVRVFFRIVTGRIESRDGKFDGEKWLIRDLYSVKFSDWSGFGAELLGWKPL